MPRFPAIFPLSSLDGSNGFEITGVDQSGGQSVSAAGDINNDGFGDLIIGASEADPNGMGSGASYVMFGKAGGFGASISLSTLNGGNGFKISGAAMLDHSGFSVASAGDVNGDGFDDLIVGAPGVVPGGATYSRGASYVIFGKAAGFAANLNLSALNGSNGFRIDGVADVDLSGTSVHSASDVNGDGFDDLIIGSPYANVNNLLRDYGAVDVVFGKAGGFGPVFDLATLDGRNGFNISGERENDNAGLSVSSAGDFDGDGLNDMIVGSEAGRAYVVYGNSRNFDPEIHLNSIANLGGFKLIGARPAEQAGRAVSGVGDVNGDGFDDIILGAPFAGTINTGACHVVFGSATRPIDNVRLTDLDGSSGFKIAGVLPGDLSGSAVSAAGDINGDGFADILIGAPDADPNGSSSGASYVIFGKAAAFNTVFRLASLNGRNGFQITGEVVGDTSGTSVSAAGDVNGDGFDDLIVGAPGAGGLTDNGASYVIFGHATGALNRRGTEGDDILSGGEFDDTFSGRGGNDLIRSDGGNDVIAGGRRQRYTRRRRRRR